MTNKNPLTTILSLVFWNVHEHRLRAFWRIVGLFFLLLILVVILTGFAQLTIQNLQSPAFWFSGMGMLVSSLFVTMATGVSMWIAARAFDRRPVADFGLHVDRNWWLDFGFGLALGGGLMTLIFLVEWAAGWITIVDTFHTADNQQPFAIAILAPLILFICVGIYEELLSRGYLLKNLAEGLHSRFVGPRTALVIAWVLSSALFGAGHSMNPNASLTSTLYLVLAGILLGTGYVLTGELAIPIGLHISWNFFQGHVFGFPVSGGRIFQTTCIVIEQQGTKLWTGGPFGPEAGLVGACASVIGCGLIVVWVLLRYKKAALHLSLAEFKGRR
jgi:hypothetical protein